MKKNPTKAESETRAERMIESAAKQIQTRIPQIWKGMEPSLTDEYWGIMGDWGDKVRERRKREYMFEELVWNEAWEETEKFDRPMQQKLMKEVDALILKFLNSPAGKHPVSKTRDYLSRPIQQNPRSSNSSKQDYVATFKKPSGTVVVDDQNYYGSKSKVTEAAIEDAHRYGWVLMSVQLKKSFKNPVKPRKGEKTKAFVSRCMSEEKVKFPKVKQRIAVCLSKAQARRNPFNDRNLDA